MQHTTTQEMISQVVKSANWLNQPTGENAAHNHSETHQPTDEISQLVKMKHTTTQKLISQVVNSAKW